MRVEGSWFVGFAIAVPVFGVWTSGVAIRKWARIRFAVLSKRKPVKS